MLHSLNISTSVLASSLRLWRGTSCSKRHEQPEKELILFDREGDPACRIVREALTGLNLDVIIMPCPQGGRNLGNLVHESGSEQVPMLYDSNTEERRTGPNDIITYLYKQYRNSEAPEKYLDSRLNNLLSRLTTVTRLNAGNKARASKTAKLPLVLYSFESSPYSRPVRELLCELELPYQLINLGKQQWADMGPAKPRLTIAPYRPLKGSKRDQFFKEHGNVQVPYLIDPNTGRRLFESDEILAYLKQEYLRS